MPVVWPYALIQTFHQFDALTVKYPSNLHHLNLSKSSSLQQVWFDPSTTPFKPCSFATDAFSFSMRHDTSVALLASIFEDLDIKQLVEALKAVDGNVELAIDRLVKEPRTNKRSDRLPSPGSHRSPVTSRRKKAKLATIDSWLTDGSKKLSQSSSLAHINGLDSPASTSHSTHDVKDLPDRNKTAPLQTHQLRSLNDVLRHPSANSTSGSSQPKPIQSLPPLFLATPKDVSTHLPCCSLLYNILPKGLACQLYLGMLEDCQGRGSDNPAWTRNRWWLNDKEVESPHSTAFFVSNRQGQKDDCAVDYAEVSSSFLDVQISSLLKIQEPHLIMTDCGAWVASQHSIGMQGKPCRTMPSHAISCLRWKRPKLSSSLLLIKYSETSRSRCKKYSAAELPIQFSDIHMSGTVIGRLMLLRRIATVEAKKAWVGTPIK